MLSHFLRKLTSFAGRAGTDTVRADGMYWHVVPGEPAPDLTGWESAGLLTPIKQNHQRTISTATPAGGRVFVADTAGNVLARFDWRVGHDHRPALRLIEPGKVVV